MMQGVLETIHSLQVEELQVCLRQVRLPIGLTLDSVEVSGASVGLGMDPFTLDLPAPATLKVKIGPENLQTFLAELKLAGARDLRVELVSQRLVVRGIIKMVIDVKFMAVCQLRIFQERQLHVDAESVEVLGKSATNLLQPHLAKINPLLDVKDFPVPVRLSGIVISADFVEVTGFVSPPAEFAGKVGALDVS